LGSFYYFKRTESGKVDTLLNKKLEIVEWGEYRIKELFDVVGTKSLDSNAIDFVNSGINFVGRTFEDNGVQGKIEKQFFEPNKPFTITATVIGNYKYVKFQKEPYYCSQNINKLTPKSIIKKWNEKIAYYLITSLQKFVSLYDKQQGGYKLEDIKNYVIKVPIKNSKIDFEFMEKFIAEIEVKKIDQLEAYLSASGLKDYILTNEEKQVLEDFENNKIEWNKFTYQSIFNKIVQGRRLKKDDQILGNIPFVMAGVTNTGVVNYISNPIASFPINSITIDIFGNTFYRDYAFGAGDDTGVYWNSEKNYSKEIMLFFTTSMGKSLLGKFSYGTKLRSSQSLNFKMKLPTKNQQPNYEVMETLISAIQKMVIKDVVLYVEKKESN